MYGEGLLVCGRLDCNFLAKSWRDLLYATATMEPGPMNFPKVMMPFRNRVRVHFCFPSSFTDELGVAARDVARGVVERSDFIL